MTVTLHSLRELGRVRWSWDACLGDRVPATSYLPRGDYVAPRELGDRGDLAAEVDALTIRGHLDSPRRNYRRGALRVSWYRRVDCVGRPYFRVVCVWWSRFDVSHRERYTADTLRDAWHMLRRAGVITPRQYADDGALLAFVMLGNRTPSAR